MVESSSSSKKFSYAAYLRDLKGMYKKDPTASADFDKNVTDPNQK